jgi:putative N6-adenine-specific DNA methylase
MCGSGTFLIEAALKALHIAPGTLRSRFAFQKFAGFQNDAWQQVVDDTMAAEMESSPAQLFGFDIDGRVLNTARKNAVGAGVSDYITFQRSAIDVLEAPAEKGIVIVNPP